VISDEFVELSVLLDVVARAAEEVLAVCIAHDAGKTNPDVAVLEELLAQVPEPN